MEGASGFWCRPPRPRGRWAGVVGGGPLSPSAWGRGALGGGSPAPGRPLCWGRVALCGSGAGVLACPPRFPCLPGCVLGWGSGGDFERTPHQFSFKLCRAVPYKKYQTLKAWNGWGGPHAVFFLHFSLPAFICLHFSCQWGDPLTADESSVVRGAAAGFLSHSLTTRYSSHRIQIVPEILEFISKQINVMNFNKSLNHKKRSKFIIEPN